ncbi:deoxynucleoside triphosphate triphosphohydrolase SAMHD1 homolog isoform X3 [Glycine soja]|uniref:Deoxynucleoside triphosphate triphosphohydrolase SAMHD1-like isoform A n=1 Tax=Glycine soja TaxID=3848 RepID=A0A445I5Y0_GLYSO|nr:deoxynucleoside triphosphate triphosphohydrolase SAMHD1 homolog isoform X3 [Glycine soja]RZB81446.1 Deoxynucleoside triphosphate triphosphohydrolase SAMHD1-like isoform A [Glycine soja]
MGAYCNGNVSLSPSYDVASAEDPRFCKHVHDNVHGNIYLDSLSLKFIDTEQFQRLRELKQLGAVLLPSLTLRDIIGKCGSCGCKCGSCGCNCGCGFTNMVYPGAVHSRFEHSLGVYWLASQCVEKLKTYQGLELGIDRFDIQTVKLAGLLHDVGHGPFSHLFEREFLPQVISGSDWSHEQMSVDMVDYIVDEHHIDVYPQMIRRVKEMILASSEYAPSMSSSEKSFLYDIVANGRNGIDVDKFDYLLRDCRACGLGCNFEFQRLLETMRVLDDEICYRAKDYLTIHKMFATRADLYRTVYTHPKVKAIELMVVDALVHANSYLGISSNIHDPSEYWKLDDTIIKTIETTPNQELKEARELILRIRRRNLYQFCNEYPVPKDMLDNYKKVTAQDIVCSQKSGGVTLKEEDVAVCNVKIDLTRGKHNPLESIHFFKDYESDEKFTIPDDRVSHLLPTSYQDMIVKVYAKKPELVEAISEAFENFQLKTYGIKTQAHSTPQKKRRYNSFI